jgi:LacI family transcriptional regulator
MMSMQTTRAPTQADVARWTGLSQATISRVLRDDPAVLPDTKTRVFAACKALGYEVSVGARMLAAGRKALIGLSLSERVLPTDRYTSVIHQHLARQLQSSGWGTVLLTADRFDADLSRIGAAILIGVSRSDPRIAAAAAHGLPSVAIGHPDDGAFAVAPDDAMGGGVAAEHLMTFGCRRLVMLSAARDTGDPGLIRRRDAFLQMAGPAATELPITHVPTPTLAGYRAAATLSGRVDGMFCDTDEVAVGALWALRDAGRADGVRIVGFDDMPSLAEAEGLTTVAQDFAATAAAALDLRLEGERGLPPRRVVTPVKLRVRQT